MAPTEKCPRTIGRYSMHEQIASGGMASIHLGRQVGEVGFARTVAIKRMHAHYTTDDEFVGAFVDEARLCARIRHTNVVPILDVVRDEGELFLVMEYLDGVSLLELLSGVHRESAAAGQKKRIPPGIVAGVLVGVLHGLHAAHEACADDGQPLHIVHRDISPANILVGADGVPTLIDFGIAKALGRISSTKDGQLKGKLPYMSPEQICGQPVDRRADIFSAAIVLWEVLTHRRLFHVGQGAGSAAVLKRILELRIEPPSHVVPGLSQAVDDVVMRGLERDVERRFQTAAEMADALEAALAPATARTIGLYVERVAEAPLGKRRDAVRRLESSITQGPGSAIPGARKRGTVMRVLGGAAASALVAVLLVAWPGARRETAAAAAPVSTPAASPASPSSLASSTGVASPAPSSLASGAPEPALAAVSATAPPGASSTTTASSPRRSSGPLPKASPKASSVSTGAPLPLYGRK
jgi:serine/threonine protein kinase